MSFTPIETQEAFDAAIKDRIARERAKFADYDELRAKAEELDGIKEAQKSELDRANERIAELESAARDREEADRLSALRSKVSGETGVPADLISGADEDSMRESAAAIAAYAKAAVPAAPSLGEAGRFADDGRPSGPEGDGYVRDLDRAFFGEGSE